MGLIFPFPDLLEELGHVDLFVLYLEHPGMFQHPPGSCSSSGFFLEATDVEMLVTDSSIEKLNHIPALNEIFKVVSPLDIILRFVLELGNRLSNDISQEINKTSTRLEFRSICGEWKPMLCCLEQGHTKRPDVRGDCVRLAGDTLRCHVVGRADERVCVAFCAEFAAHAKIAEFNLAIAAEKDVGRFDV